MLYRNSQDYKCINNSVDHGMAVPAYSSQHGE